MSSFPDLVAIMRSFTTVSFSIGKFSFGFSKWTSIRFNNQGKPIHQLKTYTFSIWSLPKEHLCGLRLKDMVAWIIEQLIYNYMSSKFNLSLLQLFTYRIQPTDKDGPLNKVKEKCEKSSV